MEEALAKLATTSEAQDQIRAGCLASLAARERLWWGIADKVNAGRMVQRFPALAKASLAGGGLTSSTAGSEARELTLAEFRSGIHFRMEIPGITR